MRLFLKARPGLIPEKKQTSTGERTYWVNPNKENPVSLKRPKVQDLPGQQKLFQNNDGSGGHRGYFERLLQMQDKHIVEPLIEQLQNLDPGLSKQIAAKYRNYPFDSESRELDLQLDQATAFYLRRIKQDSEHADEWKKEYSEKTESPAKALNRKKRQALGLVLGDSVTYQGKRGKITGWSKRGFPMVNGESVFFEEIDRGGEENAA